MLIEMSVKDKDKKNKKYKHRFVDQWNHTEDPDKKKHTSVDT